MGGIGNCCYAICAILVVVISVILFLIGLALSAVGGALLWGVALINQYVGPMLTGLVQGVEIDNFKIDSETMVKELIEFLKPMAVGIFIAGIILVILGFCGMFGSCCKNKCLLISFVIIAGIILITEMVLLILVMTKRDEYVKSAGEYLKKEIKKNYVGIKGTNFLSLLVNLLQAMLECCGIDGGKDFRNASKWENEYSYKSNDYTFNTTLQYPLTCCKMKDFKPVDVNCTWDPTPNNSNYQIGCLKSIKEAADQYGTYLNAGIGGLFGLQVILTVLGILMLFHVLTADNKVHAAKY